VASSPAAVRCRGPRGATDCYDPVVHDAVPATIRSALPIVPPERTAALVAAIRDRLPGLRLLTDPVDRESYRRDETAFLEAGLPGAVALPTTTAEVVELVRLAGAHQVPIVPRGAGTGLSGGAAGIEGGLTIAFTQMKRILEIDPANLTVTVQPGIINADLKAAVAEHGLFYPPDPASYEQCSIGGNLGTNAGGLCCVKYGVTRDAVLGLEVVTADGTVLRLGGKNVKDVAGYALMQLFVGSQGTLGIVTEATLRLRPAPPPKLTMLAFFPSLEAAGAAVSAMTARGLGPATLELMDRATIAAVDDWQQLGLDREAAALLLVESDLPGVAAEAELEAAEAACRAAGASFTLRAADPQEADWLRQGRRLAYRALERLGVAHMEDVGVPRSRIPEMLRAIEAISARHGVPIPTFGHAGDGNLHPTLLFGRDDPTAAERDALVRDELYRAAIALGGTVTGEHGIGLARKDYLEVQRGPEVVAVMRRIKAALDPAGILNPGKMV
jgi:glycolate oxidase